MIKLTSMNQQTFYLNCSLICRIDQAPDTVITLTDGKTMMVKNTPEEIAALFLSYQRQVFGRNPILDN
ncbi:MAG: flagellar FlbD family protein [Vagococcus sp.]|uniref:flagellar FlbD family protein n=1 Tax=Vagococcus sp. TaxID=1933889 RepID=UPI002FCB71E6